MAMYLHPGGPTSQSRWRPDQGAARPDRSIQARPEGMGVKSLAVGRAAEWIFGSVPAAPS